MWSFQRVYFGISVLAVLQLHANFIYRTAWGRFWTIENTSDITSSNKEFAISIYILWSCKGCVVLEPGEMLKNCLHGSLRKPSPVCRIVEIEVAHANGAGLMCWLHPLLIMSFSYYPQADRHDSIAPQFLVYLHTAATMLRFCAYPRIIYWYRTVALYWGSILAGQHLSYDPTLTLGQSQ